MTVPTAIDHAAMPRLNPARFGCSVVQFNPTEISLFPLDETIISSAVNNTFRNCLARAK